MLIQAVFPVISFITPAVAGTPLAPAVSLAALPVRTYLLTRGETVSVVAQRAGLTVAQLKQLNQFRTFRVPFEQLGAGDELDIPAPLLSAGKVPSSLPSPDGKQQTQEMAQWLSGNASGIQSAQKYHQSMQDYVAGNFRSDMVSGAQSATEQWLSQFGTARVQLGTNDNFTLGESALDMLVPLYDNGYSLLFTQLGGRRQNDRTTLNLGAGVRLFHGNWMYGGNAFLDNDITGHNKRVGLGAEAWTNYLKLSANGYFGMTDWHQSQDFADYDERPADGFDLTAQGWLPAYPQLGGKVKYERYFGHEVALVDADTRQQNPQALTVGVEYTPIPLLTLGIDYAHGGGNKGLQGNVQFTWRPGESWSKQTSGDAVAASRLLAGSRLDLVERNNNIVLDYRKQELVKLNLPESVHDFGGGIQIINAQVTAKYGVDHIEWQVPAEFTAGGGRITALSPLQFQVRMPSWSAGAGNQYTLTASAWDPRGNASKPARVQLMVDRAGMDAAHSSLKLDGDSSLPADGQSTRRIILTAQDSLGNPVTGQAASISLTTVFSPAMQLMTPASRAMSGKTASLTASRMASVPSPTDSVTGARSSGFTESQPGVYVSVVTAGKLPGDLLLTARLDDQQPTPLKVHLVKPLSQELPDGRQSALTADRNELMADGIDKALMTLTLKDNQGRTLPDRKVTFIPSRQPGITIKAVTAHPDGTYTAELTGTEPGPLTVTVAVDGVPVALPPLTLTLSRRVLSIMRGGSLLRGHPVAGDILTASDACTDSVADKQCSTALSTYQWEVEDVPGSGHYIPVKGATTRQFTVPGNLQKRKLKVTEQ